MNKAVLLSVQPYYVFLIIARLMGWKISQEKTVEVRKDFPKDSAWDKTVYIYCSKNRQSFKRIPKQFQPLMEKLLGKVIGEFVCNSIRKGRANNLEQAYCHNNPDETCLTDEELCIYANYRKPLYFWHISDLKIYDTPKELGEFKAWRWECETLKSQFDNCRFGYAHEVHCRLCKWIRYAPQSWQYVEQLET